MTGMFRLLVKLYSVLLNLYPTSFRKEFDAQMLLDFSDMAIDAKSKGWFPFFLFCTRELVDFPVNLLKVYLEEGLVFRVLRSQPVNYGLRSAMVFGMAFGLAGLISQWVVLQLVIPDNSIFGWIQVAYFDLFQTEHGFDFINWLPSALGSILTGIVIGTAFAFLFADRTKWAGYILTAMLCWFLHQEIFGIWFYATNLPFYLGTKHFIVLSYASSILSGAFLGLIFYVSKSENRISLRLLSIGGITYPLVAYIYMKLLLKFLIIETPWMFNALMILLVVYIGSVILIAVISNSIRRVPWLVIFGAVLPLLLPRISYWSSYLVSLLIGPINFPYELPLDSPEYWPLMFRIAIDNAIYGLLLGLIIGVMFGLLPKGRLPQVTTV